MTSRAIVVGATSMLGRRVSEHLSENGIDVITCGRSSNSDIVLDLADFREVRRPQGFDADVLIHCAASFGGDDYDGTLMNERVNALGSLAVARLAELSRCKHLVLASTIICYPLPGTSGLSSYGSSKRRGEQLIESAFARTDITFCSLRLPQLYDEYGECFKHQAWLRRILAYANQGKDLALPPSPNKQNFMHVEDAAALMSASVHRGLSGVWPATHPDSISYLDIAKLAYAEFNRGGDIVEASNKKPFTERLIPESSPLFDTLGLVPRISMQDGIKRLKENCHPEKFGDLDVE